MHAVYVPAGSQSTEAGVRRGRTVVGRTLSGKITKHWRQVGSSNAVQRDEKLAAHAQTKNHLERNNLNNYKSLHQVNRQVEKPLLARTHRLSHAQRRQHFTSMRRGVQLHSMDSLAEEVDSDAEQDLSGNESIKDEGELSPEARMWRSVVDPSSGKTYYYHVSTRESVWEKPLALCSAQERAAVARRCDQQRTFFAEMEGNIRRKIQQGLLFADAPEQATSSEREEYAAAGRVAHRENDWGQEMRLPNKLCRTISTMDDKVVAELCAISPLHSTTLSSPEEGASACFPASPYYLDSSGGNHSPPGLAPLAPAWTTSCPAVLRRLGDRNASAASSRVKDTAAKSAARDSNHRASPQRHRRRACRSSRGGAREDTCGADGGGLSDVESGVFHGVRRRGGGAGRGTRKLHAQLTRRNSTSTIYLAAHDTLSDPDLDATIRCVCAVLRAHMIEARADDGRGRLGRQRGAGEDVGGGQQAMRRASTNVDTNEQGGLSAWSSATSDSPWSWECLSIFQDAPLSRSERERSREGAACDQWGGPRPCAVPSLRKITAFYRDLYHGARLKFDCVVLSLIYVERLMKVWDDHSMWNRDFSELCPSFTLWRLNQLERAVLELLRFNVKVLGSEYAKYYFHLRSMCVRSGLSVDCAPIHPLDMEDVRTLEDLSSKLEYVSVGQQKQSAKALTLQNAADVRLLQRVARNRYVRADKHACAVGVEQGVV